MEDTMQRTNPFKPLYDKCNYGGPKYKFANLPAFPRFMDVEPTNYCNFKCLFCPTGTGMMQRPRGYMEEKIFTSVLEQIIPHKTPVRFIGWGEPLLHKQILEWCRRLHDNGIMIHLGTNGRLLTDELMDELLDIPIDSIKFSFQGVDVRSYAEMRSIDYFDALMGKVKQFYQKRGDRERPFIHVSTTVTYETKEQIKAFYDYVSTFVDLVTVGKTMLERIDLEKVKLPQGKKDLLATLIEQETLVKVHPECPEVYDKISVNWDGKITACCGDADDMMIVGDLSKGTLLDAWTSPRMNGYRKVLSQEGGHDKLPLCKTCFDYIGVTDAGRVNTFEKTPAGKL
jgi:MoaA/NifB/PqqE/SkfB family radical SAM enzyme